MSFAILLTGLSGMVAQVIILRELLVSFYGSELALGLILANWIAAEAAGALFIGKVTGRIKNKISLFLILQIIFSICLPVAIYLARTFKAFLNIPFGEAAGLGVFFWASFIVILPAAFCHGGLFSLFCKIYPQGNNNSATPIARVYTMEIIGTIIGGITLTYLLIPFLTSFQIIFIISLANTAICFIFLKSSSKFSRYLSLFSFLLFVILVSVNGAGYIENASIKKQWQNKEVLEYRNSSYGNIAVIRQVGQYTFYYNGLPVITVPSPDLSFVQEFGNLPLLFHPGPKDILVVSAGAGGLINEILKSPVRRIYYAELDPLLIELLKKYPTDLTTKELYDARTNVINEDGRYFVKNTPLKFDCIIIGLAIQADLATNRLFSREFFSLLKLKLNPGGIIALWLPGSSSYLSAELQNLNACIINSLKETFPNLRVIPGDYNIILASASEGLSGVTPEIIYSRMNERNISAAILTPNYLDYKLSRDWSSWFSAALQKAAKIKNEDLRPLAVYQMLKYEQKKFSPALMKIMELLGNITLRSVVFLILILTLLMSLFTNKKRNSNLPILYGIATTGFFSMLINLVLIFGFQVFYGYLYYKIGLLIAVFMAGTALGSIWMGARLQAFKYGLGFFIGLESAIIVFTLSLAAVMTKLSSYHGSSGLIFIALFFAAGALTGLEFPLAAKLYLKSKKEIGTAAGALYAVDLLGGWLAGICGGLILIPVLGVPGACMAAAGLKLSSLIILILVKRL